MTVHDLFTRTGRKRARRLRLARRGPGLAGLPRRGPCGGPATARWPRRLAAMDSALAVETPRLASMFAMFNELAAGEPVGAERLPPRAWPRPRPAQVVFLAALAAAVALSVVLITQLHSVMRPCQASGRASSATSPTALSTPPLPASPSASPPASPTAGQAGALSAGQAEFSPLRYLGCPAYAATNK
jgi:hypothetical protein